MKKTSVVLGIAVLLLTGCSATATETTSTAPPVTTAPPAETPTPTPTAEPEQGTRANPLKPGESRKLMAESMWLVGADGPTKVKNGYVVLPLKVGIDWEAGLAQAEEAGDAWDVENEGIDPYGSITVTFVTKSGRTYDTMENYNVDIKNEFYEVGTVYPPTETLKANVAISVPDDEVAGGVWKVQNMQGDSVFLALD